MENRILLNSFQAWAYDYATALGWHVTRHGNWIDLHRDGACIECMTYGEVQAACDGATV